MKLLATGDLHLGAGADLGLTAGARLAEQEHVLEQIVDLAIAEQVAAVLFAGDAFEGPSVTPEQYAAFQRPLRRLQAAAIPLVAITGNGRHDAAMRDVKAPEVLGDVAQVFTAPAVVVPWPGVVVCLLPWAPVSRIVAAYDGEVDRDQVNVLAADLLLEVARGLAATAEAGHPGVQRILMTHFAISGDIDGISTFAREPLLPLAELERLDFDAIVAGHFHRPQELMSTPDDPVMPIFYVGSPMPLNFGEGHYEHGCWILESYTVVEHRPEVVGWSPRFVPLESRPFQTVDCTADDAQVATEEDDVWHIEGVIDVEGSFVKVRYTATDAQSRKIDQGALGAAFEEAGAYRVWVEQTVERADVVRAAGDTIVREDLDPLDQLAAYLQHAGINGDVGAGIIERTRVLLEQVGS